MVRTILFICLSFSGWNISHRIGFDIFREIVLPRHQFLRTIPQPFAPFWPNTIQVFTFQSWGFSRIEQLIARKSDFVWKGKQFLPLLSSRQFFIFEAKIYVSTAFLKPRLLGITNIFVHTYTINNTYISDIFIIIWRKNSFKKCAFLEERYMPSSIMKDFHYYMRITFMNNLPN